MNARIFFALSLVGGLAGCEVSDLSAPGDFSGAKWDIDAVAALPVQTDPYLSGLQEGYLKLARAEFEEFDWADGAEFIARARTAADGQGLAPFDPESRVTDGPEVDGLTAAFMELNGFIASKGAMLRAGRQIADAQVAYDCWLQEAQEGHQSADIEACREQYQLLILLARDLGALPDDMAVVLPEEGGEIGGIEISQNGRTVALDTAFAAAGTGETLGGVAVEEGEIREAFAGALGAQPPPPVEFVLTFDFNSSRINDEGYDLIAQSAEEALSRAAAEVIVTGFADAPGDARANLALSRYRAARVREEVLRELGNREKKTPVSVTTGARGERDLLVSTTGEERRNRRVVILVR